MRSKIIINSTVAFTIASIAEMTLHEAGHFLASVMMGYSAILHHNSVQHVTEPDQARIISAAAGPIVSLLIGIAFQYMLNSKVYKGMSALTILYMSIFGYIGFMGYLMIAPFFSYGDTGFVLRAAGCPMWLIITLAIIAAGVAFMIMKSLAVHFIAMMSEKTVADPRLRRKFIYNLVFIPLFIGIAVTTLLNLPVPTTLSLIAPLTSPYMILWPFGYYLKSKGKYYDDEERIAYTIPIKWVVVLIVVIIMNRILVPGWEL